MEDLTKALNILGQVASIVVVIAGIGAAIARTWVAERISSYYRLHLEQELAAQAHGYSQELEKQKGAIMQEFEIYRANIDIKRSIALKDAEARTNAMRDLAYALADYATECASIPTMPPHLRTANGQEFLDALRGVRKAHRSAELFISNNLSQQVAKAIADGGAFVRLYPDTNNVVLLNTDPQVLAIIQQFAAAKNAVRQQFEAQPNPLV